MLEEVCSVRFVQRLNEYQMSLPVSRERERESAGSQLRVTVADVGDSSGTQRKANVRR
jgi:hypothetical protein